MKINQLRKLFKFFLITFSMINRFYFLIGKEISIYVIILLLTLVVSTILELIGIGLIPVFISLISDQDLFYT